MRLPLPHILAALAICTFTAYRATAATNNDYDDNGVFVQGDSLAVKLTQAGTLPDVLDASNVKISSIKRLRLQGPINSVDISMFSQADPEFSDLQTIDLSDAILTPDGGRYAQGGGGGPEIFTSVDYYLSPKDTVKFVREVSSNLFVYSCSYYDCFDMNLSGAFKEQSKTLQKLYLPANQKSLGYQMASDCKLLSVVTCSPNIKEVKQYAFDDCKSLTHIDGLKPVCVEEHAFSNSGLQRLDFSLLTELGTKAFSNTQISEADISGIDSIPAYAFSTCENLKNVKFSSNLRFVGKEAFRGTALAELPDFSGLDKICSTSFADTPWIQAQFKANSGVAYMGNRAIAADLDVNAPNPLVIKEGTTEIIDDFVQIKEPYYTAEREVVLPQSLRRIGLRAFFGSNITGVNLPEGLEIIDGLAFNGTKIEKVTIPSTLKKCYGLNSEELRSITIPDIECEYADTLEDKWEGEYYNYYGDGMSFIDCPKLRTVNYLAHNLPDETSPRFAPVTLNIGPNVRRIPNKICYMAKKLQALNFKERPDSLPLTIGQSAFYGTNIINIQLPEYVDSIGNEAFAFCQTRNKVDLPANLKYIGEYAFESCYADTISVPCKNAFVGQSAFYNCYYLKHVDYNVTNTPAIHLFHNCNSLQSVNVGADVRRLPEEIFSGCPQLSKFDFEESKLPLTIGDRAFESSKALAKNFTFPLRTDSIGTSVFGNCLFNEITIPENVRYVGWMRNDSLKHIVWNARNGDMYTDGDKTIEHVTIGPKVEKLPTRLFCGMNKLSDIDFTPRTDDTPLEIGDFAFSGCPNLQHVTIPEFVTRIGSSAYKGTFEGNSGEMRTLDYRAHNAKYEAANAQASILGPFSSQDELRKIIIGKNVLRMPECFAQDCENLDSVIFEPRDGNTNLVVMRWAFVGCNKLKSITFPEHTTMLGRMLFVDGDLRTVSLPSTMGTIFYNTFQGCQLDTIYAHMPWYDGQDNMTMGAASPDDFEGLKPNRGTILCVYPEYAQAYANHPIWSLCTIKGIDGSDVDVTYPAVGINNAETENASDMSTLGGTIYTPSGQRITQLQHGVNIIRTQQGKVVKVLK